MKKNLLFVFPIVAFSLSAQAQMPKGTVMLGGSFSFGSGKSETTGNEIKSRNYGFSPSIGVAIKENTFTGFQVRYGHSTDDYPNDSYDHLNENYGTEVFLRKYLPLGKAFYLFGHAGLNYSRYNNKDERDTYKYTSKGWSTGLNLYPGISYAVNEKFQLEASLGNMASISFGSSETENTTSGQTTNSSKQKGFSISSSLSSDSMISIGFRFCFTKKKKV